VSADASEGRRIVDAMAYMTIATADAAGTPWASPVWFAHRGYAEFIWVSRPGTRHSQNIAARRQVAITIYDSTVLIYTGQAVYLEAEAGEVPDGEIDGAMEAFSKRSIDQGASAWSRDDVTGDAELRAYRAIPSAAYVLDTGDRRVAVELAD
jgi:nitroimidazol reductase NimA-like FMN-containing flavoprotein (pyridoxamine 5'-phosphate oxidase superfamily)